MYPAASPRRTSPHPRRGAVVFEAILWVPVFVGLLAALVEFGLILTGLQHVKAACRAGAKVAAELSVEDLSDSETATTRHIGQVQTAVNRSLSSAGFTAHQVMLEHNGHCVGAPRQLTVGSCSHCQAPAEVLPTATAVPGGMVRVTVCVPVREFTPDFLSTIGFSIADRTAKYSVVFPYENCR